MQELSFTHRELLGAGSFARQGAVLACLIGLFAFIGPFGTYDSIGLAGRFGYWALALGANWLVCASVVMLTLRLTDAWTGSSRLLAVAGAALTAAFPGTGVVHTAEILFRPEYEGDNALPTIYLGVAVLMVAISLLVVAVLPRRRTAPAEEEALPSGEPGAAPPSSRFLDRLPPHLGRDLVYLRMADHYVEAFTAAGSTLVLMRFADAVAELEGTGGLRVHRSYWVAKAHVTRATRCNGRTVLHLTGGHEAPVSRGYLAAVREAGLA